MGDQLYWDNGKKEWVPMDLQNLGGQELKELITNGSIGRFPFPQK